MPTSRRLTRLTDHRWARLDRWADSFFRLPPLLPAPARTCAAVGAWLAAGAGPGDVAPMERLLLEARRLTAPAAPPAA